MRLFLFLSTALVLLLFLLTSVAAQQSSAPDYTHVSITMKAEGGPCGCVYANDNDLSCCPAYSVAVDENGTVVYNGIGGVKARGERVHATTISIDIDGKKNNEKKLIRKKPATLRRS
jgi:hypothetical protein